jgi:hypothetical protein
MQDIMFVGNARCFHTMDWYRNAKRLYHPRPVPFATDLIDGEDYIKLATAEDDIVHLHNIDRFLPRKQSSFGNIWAERVSMTERPASRMLHRPYRSAPIGAATVASWQSEEEAL